MDPEGVRGDLRRGRRWHHHRQRQRQQRRGGPHDRSGHRARRCGGSHDVSTRSPTRPHRCLRGSGRRATRGAGDGAGGDGRSGSASTGTRPRRDARRTPVTELLSDRVTE